MKDLHRKIYRTNRTTGQRAVVYKVLLFLMVNTLFGLSSDLKETTQSKKILVLYSYESVMPLYEDLDPLIRNKFISDLTDRSHLYIEYLDLSRFHDNVYIQRLSDLLRYKYSTNHMDLIISINPPAFHFLMEHGERLFPEIPNVFLSLGAIHLEDRDLNPNMTGIVTKENFVKKTLEVALQIHPNTRQIVVVSGTSESDRGLVAEARQTFQEYENALVFIYLTEATIQEIQKKVHNLPEDTAVLYLSFLWDKTGDAHIPQEALSQIADSSNAPIYGYFHTYLGHGIVGGYLHDFDNEIEKAVTIGTRILHGEKPMDIPIEISEASYMFDWQMMRRWNIDEKNLPPHSKIVNKETSFWEMYKRRIMMIIVLIIIEAFLIFLLYINLLKRRKAEYALKIAHDDLEEKVKKRTTELTRMNKELRHEIRVRKRTELELQESLESLKSSQRATMNLMEDLSIEVDERKKAQHKIKEYSENLEKMVEERTKELREQTRKLEESQKALTYLLEDVNEYREELETINMRLQDANKELEAFSYSVSHDLRAPLRAIDGFSLALLEDYHDMLDDQGKNYLDRVRKASQRMALLIDDILQLSRVTRSPLTRKQVNLSKLAQEIAEELRNAYPHQKMELRIQQGLTGSGDVRLLRIALQNLMENAWKFTQKNPSPTFEFGITKNKTKNAFFIRDNGTGFNMKYADKLFGPFQRLHSSKEFEGTGIGLATVQRIIHRHGGHVWAESKPEKGSTFYFTLD